MLGTLFGLALLGMTIGLVVAMPGGKSSPWILYQLATTAGWYGYQATSAAAKAQRVLALSIVPTSAMSAWGRGWLQAQAMIWIFGLTVDLIATGRNVSGADTWFVPGALLAVQGTAALAALAEQQRAMRAWSAAPWILAIVTMIFLHGKWQIDSPIATASVGFALLSFGGQLLRIAHSQLGPLERLPVWYAPQKPGTRLRRFLLRWTPMSQPARGPWWQPWVMVLWTSVYALWLGPAGLSGPGGLGSVAVPFRLLFVGVLTMMFSQTLSLQQLHWRRLLLPGGPLRTRIGTEVFCSTGTAYLVIAPFAAFLFAAVAWWFGASPRAIGEHVMRGLVLIPESAFAIAAATVVMAVLKGRMSKLSSWLFLLAMLATAGMLVSIGWTYNGWRSASTPEWMQAGTGYAMTLVVASVILVFLGNRLWMQRDLHVLLRRGDADA